MLLVSLLAGLLLTVPDAPLYESALIFPPEDFHNHSSSIVETPQGDLIVCWFHGKGERTDDTLVILGARKNKGESTWSKPFLMADNQDLPDQNCTLFIDADGRLWMFWISAMDNLVRSYFIKYRTSMDYEGDGAPNWNWQDALFCRPTDATQAFTENLDQRVAEIQASTELSDERKQHYMGRADEIRKVIDDKLFQRLGWMPRQPPMMLSDKRMMLGLYSDTFNCSMFAFTEDAGKTWEFSRPLISRGIQPSTVQRRDGSLVTYMRDSPVVRQAESTDGGMTWNEVPLDIVNSGSSVAALALKNGHWVMAVNDVPDGRHRLTLYLSTDEGKTWGAKRALEDLPEEMGTGSYPTLIQAADGSIHCTYTHEDKAKFPGKTIKHVRLNEAWITATP
jgi:predicted neuraminidase